jgi:two-component system NarL family sensor kinase
MKLLLPFLFLFLLSNHARAGVVADSLQTLLSTNLNDTSKATIYKQLSDYYRSFDFEKSIYYANEGLKIAQRNKFYNKTAGFYKQLGVIYYLNGNHDIALRNYLNAVKLFEDHNDISGAANVYIELSVLLRKHNDMNLAITYLNEAIDLFNKNSDLNGIANSYNNLGIVYESKNELDSALLWYSNALKLYESLPDANLGVSYSLCYLGGVYAMQKEYEKALDVLNKSLALRLALDDKYAICQSYTALAECYSSKGEYNNAIINFKKSIDIAKEIHFPDILQYNYEQVANIYQQTDNYKDALEYYSLYQSVKDSLYTNAQMSQIEELKSKFESDKKEQKLALANKENALKDLELRRKNFFIALGFGLVVLISLFGYLIYNRYKIKKEAELFATRAHHKEQTAKSVIDAEERERKRIAGDLHDGIGQMLSAAKMNLSALNEELHFEKQEQSVFFNRTQDIIDECCREVRTLSHQMMPNVLLENGLASAVREFVSKIDSPRLKVNFQTHGLEQRLDETTETVLYRVIQECVNNVIKHSEASTLDIQIIKDEKEISVTIEDNGKGFNMANKENIEGIGMKNIKTRVEYLNGFVNFDSSEGRGTHVYVEIPLS